MSAAGAPVPGNSIVIFHQPFLVNGGDPDLAAAGARPEKDKHARADWDLKRAVEWLKAIRTECGAPDHDGVLLEAIDPPMIGRNAADALFFKDFISQLEQAGKAIGGPAGAKLSAAKLAGPWSKLPPGHTLVLLLHGTTATSGGKKVGGIKLYDDHASNVIALGEDHLSHMVLVGDEVKLDPAIDFDEAIQQRIPLVQALRAAPFQRIVLLACGTADRLKDFAPRLAALTGKVVHHQNPHPVWIDFVKPNADPRTHVGPDENPANAATGKAWLPTNGTVKLQATKSTFLPGSMEIAQP